MDYCEEELVMPQSNAHLIQRKPEAVCTVIEYHKRKQYIKHDKEVRARAAVSYGLIIVYIATVIYGTALAIAVSRIVIP